ncbi:MAG: hypothetical protein ACLP1D_28210 [Xanthobacteraceae bacterium]
MSPTPDPDDFVEKPHTRDTVYVTHPGGKPQAMPSMVTTRAPDAPREEFRGEAAAPPPLAAKLATDIDPDVMEGWSRLTVEEREKTIDAADDMLAWFVRHLHDAVATS